jgi:hypothetical protein
MCWAWTQQRFVHPDDVDIAEAKWRDALVTGETLHIEERIRRADGECRWHLVERVPLRDENGNILGWYASSYDIDDRRRAESALQVSQTQLVNAERELRLTLDSIPILAWRTRPDCFCEYANTLAGSHRPFPGASLGVGMADGHSSGGPHAAPLRLAGDLGVREVGRSRGAHAPLRWRVPLVPVPACASVR